MLGHTCQFSIGRDNLFFKSTCVFFKNDTASPIVKPVHALYVVDRLKLIENLNRSESFELCPLVELRLYKITW